MTACLNHDFHILHALRDGHDEWNNRCVTVVCAFCGQVRKLYENGTVNVLVREGNVTWPKSTINNGTPITDKNTTGGQR